MKNPKAVDLIDQLNQAAEQAIADFGIDHPTNGRFEAFTVDRLICDNESIRLATDLHVRAVETPGHTRDCISYLIEETKILLSSEALGQEHQNKVIVTDCLSDYDAYYASLLKLVSLGAEYICPGHFFVYTGKDARRYTEKAAAACLRFRTLVETYHREAHGDVKKVMRRIKSIEYDGSSGPKQPEAAYLINLEARVKAVLHALSLLPDEQETDVQRQLQ